MGSLRDAARFALPSLAGRESSPALGDHRSLGAALFAHIMVDFHTPPYRGACLFICRPLHSWVAAMHFKWSFAHSQTALRRRRKGPTNTSSSSAVSHPSSSALFTDRSSTLNVALGATNSGKEKFRDASKAGCSCRATNCMRAKYKRYQKACSLRVRTHPWLSRQ